LEGLDALVCSLFLSDGVEPEAEGQVVALGGEEMGAQVLLVAGLKERGVEVALFGEKFDVVEVLAAVARELGEDQVVRGKSAQLERAKAWGDEIDEVVFVAVGELGDGDHVGIEPVFLGEWCVFPCKLEELQGGALGYAGEKVDVVRGTGQAEADGKDEAAKTVQFEGVMEFGVDFAKERVPGFWEGLKR